MQTAGQSSDIAEQVVQFLRFLTACLIFFSAVAACRWGIRTLLLDRGRRSTRWSNLFSAVNFVVLAFLLLLRSPASKLFAALGAKINRLVPASQRGWPAATMVGIHYMLIATSALFLAFYALGVVYRFGDRRIDFWQSRLRASGTVESNPRFHASRISRTGIRLIRTILATALVIVYFLYGFAIFPRTRTLTDTLLVFLGPPLQGAARACRNYVPNLGYLFVILLFAWVLRKALKYFFNSIEGGVLVFSGFPVEWAEPTYKLSRTVLLLLVLLVSFPYLPGANSPFFRGFSLFFGALVTFGSSGVIGNLFAGILLTYQRAFRIGDVVRIEGVFGKVIEKTLLATRVVTAGN